MGCCAQTPHGGRRVASLLAAFTWLGGPIASCQTFGGADVWRQLHDQGIEFLGMARMAGPSERSSLCEQAEESCRLALEYHPGSAHPHNCLGLVVLDCDGDVERAIQHFKDAIAENSDFVEAHSNLGLAFLRSSPPNYTTAIEEFEAALAIAPGFLDARKNLALALLREGTRSGALGGTDARRKYFKEARSHLLRASMMDRGDPEVHHNLGFMDLIAGDLARAEASFVRCLTLDPSDARCHYNLGNVQLALERPDEAIMSFSSALHGHHTDQVAVPARRNLRVAYERSAQADGALKRYLDSIRAEPGLPEHHHALAKAYAERGLLDRAVEEWRTAIRLDPAFCPPHGHLAMDAHRQLDTQRTVAHCSAFLECEQRSPHPLSRASTAVARCQALLQRLREGSLPP